MDGRHEGRAGEAPAEEVVVLDDVPELFRCEGNQTANGGVLECWSAGVMGGGKGNGLVVGVQGQNETFAAEGAPGHDGFPEKGAIHSWVRVFEEFDDGAGFDEVFAENPA